MFRGRIYQQETKSPNYRISKMDRYYLHYLQVPQVQTESTKNKFYRDRGYVNLWGSAIR